MSRPLDIESDVVSEPIVLQDGAFCLRLGDRNVPLRMGGAPVGSFISGWRPAFAYLGFAPFILLQFESDAGEAAAWIVDADGTRLGGAVAELAPEIRDALRAAAAPRVGMFVRAVLQQPDLSLDPASRAFLRLPERLRHEIGQLCAASALPPVRRVVLGAALDPWDDAWGLDREHTETLLTLPFQERVLRTVQDSMLSWPSPVNGRALRVQGSLCSDDFRFAYRLADFEHGLVSYAIVSHHHAATLGLYVPALGLVLLRDECTTNHFDIFIPSLRDWLIPLVCRFGDMLEGYFRAGAGRVASIMRGWPSMHLGHQLLNELSGIDWFLRSAAGPYWPGWVVPGPGTELWGLIDEVFPELQGRVNRSAPSADLAIKASYETGTCLVRITSEYISAQLQGRLRHSVEKDPVHKEVRRLVQGRARPDAPVILIGLRVENRTMVDLPEFCEELLDQVARTFPGTILVLDGHNSGHDGRVVMSHGELGAHRSPLEVERQIAAHLLRLQVGRDVMVVDTLGAPIWASLAWCQQADCFFSIWGASLAKYRWVCNKPGLVASSSWNLMHRADLRIYDSPQFMENPTRLVFVEASHIEDWEKAPLLIAFGPDQPSFSNFKANNVDIISTLLRGVSNLSNELEL